MGDKNLKRIGALTALMNQLQGPQVEQAKVANQSRGQDFDLLAGLLGLDQKQQISDAQIANDKYGTDLRHEDNTAQIAQGRYATDTQKGISDADLAQRVYEMNAKQGMAAADIANSRYGVDLHHEDQMAANKIGQDTNFNAAMLNYANQPAGIREAYNMMYPQLVAGQHTADAANSATPVSPHPRNKAELDAILGNQKKTTTALPPVAVGMGSLMQPPPVVPRSSGRGNLGQPEIKTRGGRVIPRADDPLTRLFRSLGYGQQ